MTGPRFIPPGPPSSAAAGAAAGSVAGAQAATAIAIAPASSVKINTPTALTMALHNNRVVTLNPGAVISVAWAQTGDGFGCIVINNTGSDVKPTLSGFSTSDITHPYGFTKLVSGGMSALLATSPDAGATRQLQAGGALT